MFFRDRAWTLPGWTYFWRCLPQSQISVVALVGSDSVEMRYREW